jgi:hypothetical protein
LSFDEVDVIDYCLSSYVMTLWQPELLNYLHFALLSGNALIAFPT